MTNKMNATFYHILCFKHLGSNVNSMDILIKRKSETVNIDNVNVVFNYICNIKLSLPKLMCTQIHAMESILILE